MKGITWYHQTLCNFINKVCVLLPLWGESEVLFKEHEVFDRAAVAHDVEQLSANHKVGGSIPVPCGLHHVRGSLNPKLILFAPDELVSPWVSASITYGWILVVKHFEWSLRPERCYISKVQRIISLSPAMTHQETSAFLLSLHSHACGSYSSGGVFHLDDNFFSFFFFFSSNRDSRKPQRRRHLTRGENKVQ